MSSTMQTGYVPALQQPQSSTKTGSTLIISVHDLGPEYRHYRQAELNQTDIGLRNLLDQCELVYIDPKAGICSTESCCQCITYPTNAILNECLSCCLICFQGCKIKTCRFKGYHNSPYSTSFKLPHEEYNSLEAIYGRLYPNEANTSAGIKIEFKPRKTFCCCQRLADATITPHPVYRDPCPILTCCNNPQPYIRVKADKIYTKLKAKSGLASQNITATPIRLESTIYHYTDPNRQKEDTTPITGVCTIVEHDNGNDIISFINYNNGQNTSTRHNPSQVLSAPQSINMQRI